MSRQPASQRSRIDGWRGISVLMVIVGHLFAYRAKDLYPIEALNSLGLSLGSKTFAIISSLGTLGVCFFFLISGYLITSLLVAEEGKRDHVNLKAFYIRRAFRIMPAFYFYVLAVFLFGRSGLIIVDDEAVLRSSIYICNFSGFSCSWWLAHTWSLAVEEQFYLVWPMIFVFAAALRRRGAIALLIALFVGSLFIAPLGSFIYIMVGVVVALFAGLRERFALIDSRWVWILFAALITLPAAPHFMIKIAAPIQPALAAVVLFGTLFGQSTCLLPVMLRSAWLNKIGLVSYSLYLWQQLSLAPAAWGGTVTGAETLYSYANIALAFAFIPMAITSYFLIESPMRSIGHRISRQITDRAASPITADSAT